jgi:phytoene synthase
MNQNVSQYETALRPPADGGRSDLSRQLSRRGQAESLAAHDEQAARMLEEAYRECRQLTRHHARTFYLASHFLPKRKRNACYAIYAFCRYVDDLADAGANLDGPYAERTRTVIESWRSDLANLYQSYSDGSNEHSPHLNDRSRRMVMLAWGDVLNRYHIPLKLPEMVIEGCMTDVAPRVRIETFQELRNYCVQVASSVGLMTARVFGYTEPDAEARAIDLGIAMQLTNIIRDVGEDAANNRIYLPLDELRTFGVTIEDIRKGRLTPQFRHLIDFQIARARRYYQSADEGIHLLDPDSRTTVHLMSKNYRGILDAVERNGYDVFGQRAYVSLARKLRTLPAAWLSGRM